MSDDKQQEEDVAGLFRKFGGDASSYKEFAPVESAGHAAGSWPLVNGGTRPADAPATPSAHASAAPVLAPLHPPSPAPVGLAVSPAAAPLPNAAPRELDALFARLAGTSEPAAAAGAGLLSRWRRPH